MMQNAITMPATARYNQWPDRILFLYLIVLVFLARLPEFTFFAHRIASPAIVLYVLLTRLDTLKRLPTEIWAYIGFTIWASMGWFMLDITSGFYGYLSVMLQIVFLMIVVYALIVERGSIDVVLWAYFTSMSLVVAYGILQGDIFFATNLQEAVRVTGSGRLDNANGFAFFMLLGIASGLYLVTMKRNLVIRLAIAASISVFAYFIILSASRKGFMTLVVMLALWTLIMMNLTAIRRVVLLLLLPVIYILFNSLFTIVMTQTYMGERFERVNTLDALQGNVRYMLAMEGIQFWTENPLFGIGLGGFRTMSSVGLYAHNDYIEVLSTTGSPGFLLYMAIYVILYYRLLELHHRARDKKIRLQLSFFIILLLTFNFIAHARPHFLELFVMSIIASIIGYVHYLRRNPHLLNPGRAGNAQHRP